MSDPDHTAAASLLADAWERRRVKLRDFYVVERGMSFDEAEEQATAAIRRLQTGTQTS